MKTAIIILNYNDAERTGALVRTLRNYSCPDHIIVVDNCSSDDSFSRLSALSSDRVDLLRTRKNGGYARGNNAGIRYAIEKYRPDVLFVANPDVSFSEETATAMAKLIMENQGSGASCPIGVCAPLVNQGYNVWDLPGFPGIIMSLFLVAFTLHKRRIRKRILSDSRPVFPVGVVEGSFLAISRQAYEKAGGLDPRTFLYAEEIIFAKRLKEAGFIECVLSNYRYDHLHSASIRKEYHSSKAAAFHHFRDSFRIYNRYYLHTGPVRNFIFDLAWGAAYLERRLYDFLKTIL
ncbi:MAG: glycosyltransferase family 2 protein [Lachnospiraceae bacterium]|nr:glycosyltransferase family 2 protein [Lachnospiraceae bacterium]